jgi:membrane-bound ClpP family serine protease
MAPALCITPEFYYLGKTMNYWTWILGSANSARALGTQLLTALQREDSSQNTLEDSIYTALSLLTFLTGVSIVLLAGGFLLSKTRFFRRMALSTVQATHQGYTARIHPNSLIGLQGVAQTPLRPAGKAVIRGIHYDVSTLGTYVAPGAAVVVTGVAGTSLIVQAIRQV